MGILTKKQLSEIVDDEENIIGTEAVPVTGSNKETEADGTTDRNVRMHGQNFKNDFLGRFGFYFYESKEDASKLKNDLAKIMYDKFAETLKYYHDNPDKLEDDYTKHFKGSIEDMDEPPINSIDYEWAGKIMDVIEPHLKKKLDESKVTKEELVKKQKKTIQSKKTDKDLLSKNDLDKISDILSGLPKKQIDQLKDILENLK